MCKIILIVILLLWAFAGSPVFAEKLTLKDCVKTALSNHPDIKASMGNVRKADSQIMQSLSNYYPQISAYGNYTRYRYSSINSLLQSSGSGGNSSGANPPANINLNGPFSYDYYNDYISLSQNIYDFGKTKYDVLVAKEGLSSAKYDLITKQFEIALQAEQAFYQTISAKKLLEIKEEAVVQQQEHLNQASAFFKQGLKAKIDVAKAETDLAQAKIELIKAQNSYKVQLATLSNSMGFRKTQNYELDDNLVIREINIDLDKAYESAEKHRPELKKLSADIRGSLAQKRKAEVSNLPSISGNLAYNGEGYKAPPPHYWTAGFQISFNLFDGYLAEGKAREAQESVNILKEQAESKIQAIYLEVEQSYLNLREALEQIDASKTSLNSAEENFRLAKGRYSVGLSDSTEFTDARVSLTQAKSDLITALTDYHISMAKLEKAIGMLPEI